MYIVITMITIIKSQATVNILALKSKHFENESMLMYIWHVHVDATRHEKFHVD